jgi:hypothetical protein
MSLSTPYFQLAFWTAVALPTVAIDADCERRPAGRVGAKPKAQNSVPVSIHLSHSENCVIRSNGGPAFNKCLVTRTIYFLQRRLDNERIASDKGCLH